MFAIMYQNGTTERLCETYGNDCFQAYASREVAQQDAAAYNAEDPTLKHHHYVVDLPASCIAHVVYRKPIA